MPSPFDSTSVALKPVYGSGASFAYTGTAGNSSAITAVCTRILLWSTTDCYVKVGITATATSADLPLPAFTPIELPLTDEGSRVSALQVSAGGTLYFIPLGK